MIIQWFLSAVKFLVTGLLSLLPSVTVPSWLTSSGPLATVFGYFGGFGAWIPLNLAITVATALLVLVGVSFAVKVVRIVLSLVSAGGGSAG